MRILILFVTILFAVNANADELYSVYLVRHAEKDLSNSENKDPSLTMCGEQRAGRLVAWLKGVELEEIYSSDFARTLNTAKPIAESKNLTIKAYDPHQLDKLYESLIAKQQDALVVGHSNTTNVLAGLLSATTIEELDESEYDRLYQVVRSKNSAKLQLLHQGFECSVNEGNPAEN